MATHMWCNRRHLNLIYAIVLFPNMLEILFDVDRFVKVLTTIASKSQSSTLKSVGGLLDEYEGVLMGFELNK